MKFYFITFMYGASEKTVSHTVISEHPFDWQKGANRSYPGQYVLLNWKVISEEEYLSYVNTMNM